MSEMRMRWLTGWVTHPSYWGDVAIVAVLGAAVIFVVVVMPRLAIGMRSGICRVTGARKRPFDGVADADGHRRTGVSRGNRRRGAGPDRDRVATGFAYRA